MGSRRITCGIELSCFALMSLVLRIQAHCSLNSEGLALLAFRAAVEFDPYSVLLDWNANDCNPCMWSGVQCVDGRVQMLVLNGFSLEGVLAPDLGKLTHLKTLILSQNRFSGVIPEEFGRLAMLEILDLSNNRLNGPIPSQIGQMYSLKQLLLYNNNFEGTTSLQNGKTIVLSEKQFDGNLVSKADTGFGCINRKIGHRLSHGGLNSLKKVESFFFPIRGTLIHYLNILQLSGKRSSNNNVDDLYENLPSSFEPNIQNIANAVRRKLIEQSSNLAATPATAFSAANVIALPSTRCSGSFPAVRKEKANLSPPVFSPPPLPTSHETHLNTSNDVSHSNRANGHSANTWKYIVGIASAVFVAFAAMALCIVCRARAADTVGPWRTGLSGQLQKAFVTGVPKLNRIELETACEDFSNVIGTHEDYTIYKGTLSSGVEIAVISTSISSLKQWSKRSETFFRKKIDALSRVNHKNFANLIGYCEEDEPFVRMLVFEYAPNGTLFERLHLKEFEHLDWNARTRIIMGTAYCLQYMHDLNPPVSHSNLQSNTIFMTDDYAAKIVESGFWKELADKSRGTKGSVSRHSGSISQHCVLPTLADTESNVYGFGILLLEVVTGKLPYSEEQGPIEKWVSTCLHDKESITAIVDPTLKSFKNEEVEIILEVAKECVQEDARKRPAMKDITGKLRQVIDISPDAATPRLSPLWWAELEILSAEAA